MVHDLRKRLGRRPAPRGMTLIELLIGSSIMLVVILAALSLYMQSNKVAVDQQQIHEVQNDVRAAMFLMTRDIRMAGVGLDFAYNAFFLEGTNNEDQGGDVQPDRILMMGNMEDPLNIKIQNYQGDAANLAAEDYSIESYPYPDEFYPNKVIILMPNKDSGCIACEIRIITSVTHDANGKNEKFNFSPGLAPGIDPPGGLGNSCPDSNDWDGGNAAFINVKEYWLDVTGNHPSYAAGVNGYIGGGVGGILYMTQNGIHYPVARNIENFQLQYFADWNGNTDLTDDVWMDWDPSWTPDIRSRIGQVRVFLVGRTPNPMAGVARAGVPTDVILYRRPTIADSPGMTAEQTDFRKRFVMESMATIRNTAINIYNTGNR